MLFILWCSLRSVVLKVKQKTPLRLPGWEASQVTVVEETPTYSQTQQSQVKENVILP